MGNAEASNGDSGESSGLPPALRLRGSVGGPADVLPGWSHSVKLEGKEGGSNQVAEAGSSDAVTQLNHILSKMKTQVDEWNAHHGLG